MNIDRAKWGSTSASRLPAETASQRPAVIGWLLRLNDPLAIIGATLRRAYPAASRNDDMADLLAALEARPYTKAAWRAVSQAAEPAV